MSKRSTTSTYEITDAYKKILLSPQDAKVRIEGTNDDSTKLVIFEKKMRPYEFSVQDGTLYIRPKKAKWYNFLRVGIDRSEIKLYAPASILDDISITSSVGEVDMLSINFSGAIDIQTSTGRINIENVSCKSFDSKGNSGSVSLCGISVKERIAIKRNVGRVMLKDCSAPEISVKTNTGSVCGRLPSNTAFTVSTKTGKVEIPKVPLGEAITGRCEIKTNTGNIRFE